MGSMRISLLWKGSALYTPLHIHRLSLECASLEALVWRNWEVCTVKELQIKGNCLSFLCTLFRYNNPEGVSPFLKSHYPAGSTVKCVMLNIWSVIKNRYSYLPVSRMRVADSFVSMETIAGVICGTKMSTIVGRLQVWGTKPWGFEHRQVPCALLTKLAMSNYWLFRNVMKLKRQVKKASKKEDGCGTKYWHFLAVSFSFTVSVLWQTHIVCQLLHFLSPPRSSVDLLHSTYYACNPYITQCWAKMQEFTTPNGVSCTLPMLPGMALIASGRGCLYSMLWHLYYLPFPPSSYMTGLEGSRIEYSGFLEF